jgi:catechol 2,3-dioxygenase-like lactoylglutathione lyase family enzyme
VSEVGVAPIPTYGLTHLAIGVRDVDRAFAFYEAVFGMVAVYRQPQFIQAQTPGARDVLVLEETDQQTGKSGAIAHFGFRLKDVSAIGRVAARVRAAGGTVIDEGEFCPGEPYVFALDPDGYTVEIWYEIPTPADPPPPPTSE